MKNFATILGLTARHTVAAAAAIAIADATG
jgi:hypothetical protein